MPRNPPFTSHEVRVWCASLDECRAELPRLRATLSPDERARAARFRLSRDRDDFVVCRGILRELLGGYVHRDPSAIEFSYGRHGKPAVAAPRLDGPLHFNVSHSGALALYAVTAACPVGVDVERVRTVPDFERLASQFLAPAEAGGVMALPPEKGLEGFFTCWTRKEAFLKATGEGIGRRLGADLPIDWQIHRLGPAPGYVAAVAYKHEAARLSCWHTSITTLRPTRPGLI